MTAVVVAGRVKRIRRMRQLAPPIHWTCACGTTCSCVGLPRLLPHIPCGLKKEIT